MTIYGTEEQYQKKLFNMRCPNCHHDKYCQLHSRALFQCNQCHYQALLISGTLFAHSKLPLTVWFLAIYLITQEKNGISALELLRQLGVSYNTAWRVKQKLMQAMKERDDESPLDGYGQIDDAYWGGVQRGIRGRGAKGKRPFVAAVSMNEKCTLYTCALLLFMGLRKQS